MSAIRPPVLHHKPILMFGIASFFGLDELSKLDRKYSEEVEGLEDNFNEELKNILKLGILDMKVRVLLNRRRYRQSYRFPFSVRKANTKRPKRCFTSG